MTFADPDRSGWGHVLPNECLFPACAAVSRPDGSPEPRVALPAGPSAEGCFFHRGGLYMEMGKAEDRAGGRDRASVHRAEEELGGVGRTPGPDPAYFLTASDSASPLLQGR